jgi:hypothetical protein
MNNNNDKKVQPDINMFNRQDGFAFTAMAVVVAVIFGMIGLFLKSNATLNTAASADHYSTNEAFWRAVSGIDFVLENLDFDAGESNTTHDFVYSSDVNIIIDSTINASGTTYDVASTGYHGGHMRRLTLVMEPPEPFDNTFFDIDSTANWGYSGGSACITPSFPKRFWGSSCDTCPDAWDLPEYILLEDSLPIVDLGPPLKYMCSWIGKKEQNPKGMGFTTIDSLIGITNIEISLWLGAGVDALDVDDRDNFSNEDHFYIQANDSIIVEWHGQSGGNNQPMLATKNRDDVDIGDPIPSQFTYYTFNLSNVLGSVDTLQLRFIGNTNADDKYTGYAGVTLSYDLNWIIDLSSIHEE